MMAETVEFSITGLDSLLGKLEAITYDVKRKGGRAALRKAAQVVRAAAAENAKRIDDPETAAAIHANVALRWSGRLFKRTGDLGFRVGVLGGARIPKSKKKGAEPGGPGGDTRYWAFVEFGTSDTAARPFMRTALANNIDLATKTFVTEYEKAIDRAIKRAAKAAGSN
jgi:HK97 gp10 family phage protein